jgi:hypothetical protein
VRIVIPAVSYADLLAVALPAWRALLPEASITVVTSPYESDLETVRVALQHGARPVITDAWYRGGAAFDKGSALNLAFGFEPGRVAPPRPREVCIATDADVVPFGRGPSMVRKGALYGCPRYHCPDPDTLSAHRAGRLPRTALELLPPRTGGAGSEPIPHPTTAQVRRAAGKCIGYFQMWRHAEGLRFTASRTAGGYDTRFARLFPEHRRLALLDFYLLHLGARARENWRGRVLPVWGSA